MTDTAIRPPVNVYWVPGCSSCLRVKEYLTSHGVAFESRNIHDDLTALADLASLGVRRVPIVQIGQQWADGQALKDVAQLCGIDFTAPGPLSPEVLGERVEAILNKGLEEGHNLKPEILAEEIPGGQGRTYADLYFHVFHIVETFLKHDEGVPVTFASYQHLPAPERKTLEDLLAYGNDIKQWVCAWLKQNVQSYPWDAPADVYYGQQSIHGLLERTAWHSGQHLRQVLWRLDKVDQQNRLAAAQPLFERLPMPNAVWTQQTE
ncbi:glutaredoxin domain-containing protein [Burkholderia sp. L27(2015)]|uniref:glutaredoxin domain-containing protein n=1 Tax=Burkholderia sp. L27(2015) TaxID=1641858 RepID=UPI00131E0B75|nr:glutaredoxin domain-containing protein [Burkholderia sp. L27(2015)]